MLILIRSSLQGERVVLANCKKALINGTVMLPSAALSNSKYDGYFHYHADDYFDQYDDDPKENDDGLKPLRTSA